MDVTCPNCRVPGTLPDTPGIIPETLFCGNCRTLANYQGTLWEVLACDNDAFEEIRPYYLQPNYRTDIVVPEPDEGEVPLEEVLKTIPTKVLLHFFKRVASDLRLGFESRSARLYTRRYGVRFASALELKQELNTREHLERNKNQQRALDAIKDKTRRDFPKYLDRDGYVVVCCCHRILNDDRNYPTKGTNTAVRQFYCTACSARIKYDTQLKKRLSDDT